MRLFNYVDVWCTYHISVGHCDSKLLNQHCTFDDVVHLTVTVLEPKAEKHLAYFSLELSTSARDIPWLSSEFNEGGVGYAGDVSCWINEVPLTVREESRWHYQTRVDRACSVAVLLGNGKPLQVTLRRQTLAQESSSQWFAKSTKQDRIRLLQNEHNLLAEEIRVACTNTDGGGITILATPVPWWIRFNVIVCPQYFVRRVSLVVRLLQAWWHPT